MNHKFKRKLKFIKGKWSLVEQPTGKGRNHITILYTAKTRFEVIQYMKMKGIELI